MTRRKTGFTGAMRPAVYALAVVFTAFSVVPPAVAQTATPLEATAPDVQRAQALSSLLLFEDTMALVRDEGVAGGAEMDADFLGGAGGSSWAATVERLHDSETLLTQFRDSFVQNIATDAAAMAAAEAFLGSELGSNVLRLEIEARRALMDDDIEAAAEQAYAALPDENPKRSAALDRFVVANDLIESNVMGALNANLAFYRGLSKGGAMEGMSEADMLSQVWSQESELRDETRKWLLPFLSLAYSSLSDAELDAYIVYSESPEGKRLNAVLFAAYDDVFVTLSEGLGLAAAQILASQDI